jgi:hypothetical protein
MVAFYAVNGSRVDADQGEMYALALATAEGLLEVNEVATRLKQWSTPIWDDDDWVDVELEVNDEP